MKRSIPFLLALLAACGGGRTGQIAPVAEAEVSLRRFLQAVDDSNFAAMSQHWGTSRGSAHATGEPSDYQKRMVVIQSYLNGSKYRVLSNDPVANVNNQRVLQVEMSRHGCVNMVPITMVRTGNNEWLVNQLDLEKVGSPTRGCGPSDAAPR